MVRKSTYAAAGVANDAEAALEKGADAEGVEGDEGEVDQVQADVAAVAGVPEALLPRRPRTKAALPAPGCRVTEG